MTNEARLDWIGSGLSGSRLSGFRLESVGNGAVLD